MGFGSPAPAPAPAPAAAAPAPGPAAGFAFEGCALAPHNINTQQFGGLWGSLSAEKKFSVPAPSVRSLDELRTKVEQGLNMRMVECIRKTNEGIAAGSLSGTDKVVLVHSKLRSSGAIDVMIHSPSAALSEALAAHVSQQYAV